MNTILEQINSAGFVFVKFALPMLVQSAVLIVVLLLADLLLRKKVRAVFRYWLWMLVLLKLILPTTLSSPVSLGSWLGDKLATVKLSKMSTPAESVNSPQMIDTATVAVTGTPRTDIRTAVASSPGTESVVAASFLVSPTPLTWQGIVFLVWVAAVAAMGLLLLQRAIFVTGLVAQAQNPAQLMNDAFNFCRGQMGIKSKVGLKVSANTASPAVCGLFRPVILVPQNLAPTLCSSHLKPVLLHELAHIKRGDLWINLVQTILQIIYFYNPLLWLANSVIRRIREQAVDETVQVIMGANAHQYPQTLVDVAKMAFSRPVLSLRLIGVVESKSALKGRIERMLNRPIPKTAKLGFVGAVVVALMGLLFLPMANAEKQAKVIDEEPKSTAADAHPVVVSSSPKAYSNDVSADLKEITVTFDQPMMDKSWSWVRWDAPYPETVGSPYYDDEKKTCTLPVKLEAGKAYLVAFNLEPYTSFMNVAGEPAKPYVLVFATKSEDGKPTPIPEELTTKAKSVNERAETPYTQEVFDDIQPDGTSLFKSTIRQINQSGRKITTEGFINSDFVHVTGMSDAKGRPLKFTSTHEEDIYRYGVTFNEPVLPGEVMEYTSEGTMEGLVKPVPASKDTFKYSMTHWPATDQPTRRVETYLLPPGAELISTTPEDMQRRTKNGRIELHVEKMIPAGGSITTAFQYRLTGVEGASEVSDKDKMASENLAAQGWALWQQRKLAEAEQVFEKAVLKDPANANAWNGLGWAQQNQGKALNAKVSFEKCLQIQPKHAAALNGLGWIAKAQGKPDEAIAHWEKAIEAAPDATAALNGLATTYMELKDYDKAVKYYKTWLKVEPDNADAKAGLQKAKSEKTSQINSPPEQHKPAVSVYPPSGSKMALISELQVVFDQPMMPEEFKIVDASLEEKFEDRSDVAVVRSYVVYNADKYQFSMPLILPCNWNGSIQLGGFKTAKGVEVEPIVLNYTTSRDKFSGDLLQRFEKAKQSRELSVLLENVKNARSKLKSLSETVYYTYDFGDDEKSNKAIFKMQGRNQFYVDMSEEFEMPWHIGSDGEKCWFYYEHKDTKKLVAIDCDKIAEKRISICDPFEIAEADIDTVIKQNNIEYLGTEMLDGRKCHKVRSWLVEIEHTAACSIITCWFDSETYMPAKIVSDSGRWRVSYRFVYDRVNEPINDSEFRPESVTKIEPQEPEPLDENYNTRFIRIIDGSSSGRMSINWGKYGPAGTSKSGLN